MLVVLIRSHMDLQSLQAPCLTSNLIVIQAFCFSSIWFWFFYLLGDPTAGACCAFSFGQGQLGAQPGAGRIKVPSAGPGVTVGVCNPMLAISWVAAALAQGQACSWHLPPLKGRYQSSGNGGSSTSAIPAPGFASTGTRMLLAQHRTGALQLPPCW